MAHSSTGLLISNVAEELFAEIEAIPIVDIHTHVPWERPVVGTPWDILGYHYYTEMAFSAGIPLAEIQEEKSVNEKCLAIIKFLPKMACTAPFLWLKVLLEKFFGFKETLSKENIESLSKAIKEQPATERAEKVFKESNIECIFLTNEPWESLPKNTDERLVPTFRVDSLIRPEKQALSKLSNSVETEIDSLSEFKEAVAKRFSFFLKHGVRSAAVSLGPTPKTFEVNESQARNAFEAIITGKTSAGQSIKFQAHMLDFLAGLCSEQAIPFQLMVGVERELLEKGVPQGRDLCNPTSNLKGLMWLFNKYAEQNMAFPVSVLNETQRTEQAFYARIIPSVFASGHWWIENNAPAIEESLANRLQVCPHAKILGQFSDAYTLEFVYPKLWMYKQVLANVLAERFIKSKTVKLKEAVEIAKEILYSNPKKVFKL